MTEDRRKETGRCSSLGPCAADTCFEVQLVRNFVLHSAIATLTKIRQCQIEQPCSTVVNQKLKPQRQGLPAERIARRHSFSQLGRSQATGNGSRIPLMATLELDERKPREGLL